MSHPEKQYLDIVKEILEDGEERVGRNGKVLTVFGKRMEYNILKDGFPLLTTKRVYFKGIVEELLWFLRGHTDSKLLEEKGVRIWTANTTREFLDSVGLTHLPEGSIGAGYGYQWRNFGGSYPDTNSGTDQLRYVIQELRDNPTGRRALLVAWNPQQLKQAALPPCHYSYQFFVSHGKYLSCQMIQRSCDIIAGNPWNIASTALFTCILSWALHYTPKSAIIVTGDTHIYEQHIDAAKTQIEREPRQFPKLKITKTPPVQGSSIDEIISAIESLTYDDIHLESYDPHPTIKIEMVA